MASQSTIGLGEVTQNWLSGGGEMGALMRTHDWGATPLGPVDEWPQSLRTSVSTCLNSRFAILIWWGSELVMLYNDAYREIIGSKHPAALGLPGRMCWPEIWHIIGPMLEAVVNRGEATWSDDLLLLLERHGYAEECYFTFSYSPIRDESGSVGGVFTPVKETTEKVIGERRLRTLQDLAGRSSTAKDTETVCRLAAESLSANPRDIPFSAIYLYTPDRQRASVAGSSGIGSECSGIPETLSFPGGLDGLIAAAAGSGEVQVISGLAQAYAQSSWPPGVDSIIVLPLMSPGQPFPAGFLVAGINPHKHLDQAYRTFFELVAGQIAARIAEARAYEEERKRAEALAELDRAKTLFFSNVSHEFRTPLTLMLGLLEDILNARTTSETLPREELLVVQRNGLRLLKLVNTLLDFSRIEAGRVRACYEPTDLAQLTCDVCGTFRSAIEKANLSYVVDCPPVREPVYVDREMWEKIVLNLISNAFKFTLSGEVAVSLRQAGSFMELTVRDTGAGIPEGELPHLFERFHRIEGAHGRTHEGSGIGLAFVHELVRLHGGEVRVTSRLGQGSTFTVSIPLGTAHLPSENIRLGVAETPARADARSYVEEALGWLAEGQSLETAVSNGQDSSAAAGPSGRARIIVADDNSDLRNYLRRILQEHYEVVVVSDGEAALEVLRQHPCDLVLSDVMMPHLDGFGLIQRIRSDPATCAVPVILLSARAGEESGIEGLQAGADDYLVKPFSARELLARVASHLAIARLRLEVAEQERALRREAEQDRKRWRGLIENAPAAIAVLRGSDLQFELVNAEYVRASGRAQASDLEGRPIREALPELVPQGYVDLLAEVYHTGEPVFGSRRLMKLDRSGSGTLEDRFFNCAYQPTRGQNGEIEGVLIHAVDITEEVLAHRRMEENEQHLRESEERASRRASELQAIMDAVPAAILIARGSACRELVGNRTAYELMPWRFAEASSSHPDQPKGVKLWKNGAEIGMHDLPVQAAARNRLPITGYELEVQFDDGKRQYLLGNAVPLLDESGLSRGAVGAFVDVTESKRIQDRLREKQRLESVGLLAGGIAHDFNNLLVPIMGYACVVREMLEAESPIRPFITEIEKASERAAHLTRQMLAYAGKARFVIEAIDVKAAARETASLIGASISKGITIVLEGEQSLPAVEADPGEIQQIFMNLLLNAAEAIGKESGTITIRLDLKEFDSSTAGSFQVAGDIEPGRYVCVEVNDTGCGMDEETQSKIFDPFFSTKFLGRGLGLAAVAGIVRAHKWGLRLKSAPGKGSTFQLFLRAAPPRKQELGVAIPVADVESSGSETILVVDDEEVVRRTAKLALERQGYRVLVAESGTAAVNLYRNEARRIDLILLDLSMPGMNGHETLAALQQINSEVKALISSGYSEAEALRGFSGQRTVGFVQKPYTSARLASAIKKALADR